MKIPVWPCLSINDAARISVDSIQDTFFRIDDGCVVITGWVYGIDISNWGARKGAAKVRWRPEYKCWGPY